MNVRLLNFKDSSIVMGSGVCHSNFLHEACATRSIVILADEKVSEIYGEALLVSLQKANRDVFLIAFPGGEASKTRETKATIEDQMLSKGLMRDTTIIALGGGITTDLAGYVASTYCRGVPLILLPTSLLAMVDASIGGKTGVNTSYGKNLIGSFYLPKAVVIDFDFLKTLKAEQIKEGLVEVLKIALVMDSDFVEDLEKNLTGYLSAVDKLGPLIVKSCELKLKVVKDDFEEKKGLRRTLNLGHTVGHAIEGAFGYSISHGEAVAYGVLAEAFLAKEMNFLSRKDFLRIEEMMRQFIQKRVFDANKLYEHMTLDKKNHEGIPRFVLLKSLGEVCSFAGEYCTQIEKEVIFASIDYLNSL